MHKRIITLGEIMMRFSTQAHERFIQAQDYQVVFGGAEANVAASLAHWEFSAAHVTAFPDNDLGKAARNYRSEERRVGKECGSREAPTYNNGIRKENTIYT